MSAAEVNEADYRIASSGSGWMEPGEYGPLPCGCYMVALEFDPVGPRLILLMQLKDAERHTHSTEEFRP